MHDTFAYHVTFWHIDFKLHTIYHSLKSELGTVTCFFSGTHAGPLYYYIHEHTIFCRLALDIDPAMTSQEHVNPQLALQRHVQAILDLMDHGQLRHNATVPEGIQ